MGENTLRNKKYRRKAKVCSNIKLPFPEKPIEEASDRNQNLVFVSLFP